MTELEFKSNLEGCSKNELIEMIVIQWNGLGEFIDQMKMVPNPQPKENEEDETKRTGFIRNRTNAV